MNNTCKCPSCNGDGPEDTRKPVFVCYRCGTGIFVGDDYAKVGDWDARFCARCFDQYIDECRYTASEYDRED